MVLDEADGAVGVEDKAQTRRWGGSPSLKFKRLGRSNTKVPPVGMGTMGIGGYFQPEVSHDRSYVELLQTGFDLGMTLVDTAEGYGGGHSEELVGQSIMGIRDRVFVATKFSPENSSYDGVIKAAKGSLRRLNTSYIDLYQTHWPSPRIPLRDTVKAFQRLIREGAIRYVGLSNCSVREMETAQSCLSEGTLVSMQQEYSLLERTAELSLLPLCKSGGYSLIAYSPLARGAVSKGDARFGALSELAKRYGVTESQLVLNWLVACEPVIAIPKSSSLTHLRENALAAELRISESDHERISELFRLEVRSIPTDLIRVVASEGQPVYTTLAEAVENRMNMTPSPLELSAEIKAGEMLKPVKVRLTKDRSGKEFYQLIDGRTRYWAWVIAHKGELPIPAIVQ